MSKSCYVQIKKLYPDAQLPTHGSDLAAGWDLYAYIPEGVIDIVSGGLAKIETGLAMDIEDGWYGGIYARSGLSTKKGLNLRNGVGVVDADYRGPVIVALHNTSKLTQTIQHGERIAQMIFTQVPDIFWDEVKELADTERGEGGFGSTGEK